MSENQPEPSDKELRDARRHAHGVQKNSRSDGGDDKKGRKGKGDKKGRTGHGGHGTPRP